MKNVKLVLEYLGTNYCGFQKQKNGLSVQEVLENCLEESLKEKVKTYPSGRTDAGVHAYMQVVNFFTNSTIPVDKIALLLNLKLPCDIRVLSSIEVDKNFNSRKSAVSKTYEYKIYLGTELSPFDAKRALLCKYALDVGVMQKGADKLVGTHDFSSFVASHATTKTTIRTIYSANFKREGNYLYFTISGNGFLYNMVRIIVGTLIEIGRGKMSLNTMDELLKGNKRNLAGKTVKPDGLYLKEVKYE